MKKISLVIIGGGSAGMAAAIAAKKHGVDDLLILERERYLGGILNQCIHHGFGLTEFKEELSGPEYMQRFIDQVIALNIPYQLRSQVLDISKDKIVTYTNENEGLVKLQASAIIMATGCYERNAGSILLAGDRPSGILTAGTAQRYLNIHGLMVGKKVVILGSGDIGLIMARRLTLEGAKVLCVSEIMPYSNGLNRNIVQCLNDFDIPLYLSHTVSKVIGKKRLKKVILSAVDENLNIIPNSEMEFECDTLILSVGLLPNIAILNNVDYLPSFNKSASVNQYLESSIPGLFMCGNCLHVHDVVDFVSDEGRLAGVSASLYLQNKINNNERLFKVKAGNNISYVLPHFVKTNNLDDIVFKLRVKSPLKDQILYVKSGDDVIAKFVEPALVPSEMVMIKIKKEKFDNLKDDIVLSMENKQ